MLCDSIAAEITAGMTAPETTQGVVDDYGGMQWSYFVQVDQAAQEGMLAVMVTVQQATDASLRPVSFSLVRWMIDPQLEADVEAAASEAAAASSSSSGSTDSSASGTSTSSGSSGTPSGTSSGAQGGGR